MSAEKPRNPYSLVMFGIGGKYVEVLNDVVLRVHPITDVDAEEMMTTIRGFPLLEGIRGEEPVALSVIPETLLRLSVLISDIPEIAELDINPFLLDPVAEKCRIVDIRMRLA